MGKFHIYTQILQGNALFSGKIYTAGNIFTRPPVATVATNFKSVNMTYTRLSSKFTHPFLHSNQNFTFLFGSVIFIETCAVLLMAKLDVPLRGHPQTCRGRIP